LNLAPKGSPIGRIVQQMMNLVPAGVTYG